VIFAHKLKWEKNSNRLQIIFKGKLFGTRILKVNYLVHISLFGYVSLR
jgi:hypothetical protein